MRSRLIIIAFSLLTSLSVCGQDVAIDSLENLLKNSMDDSSRITILNELSFRYQAYKPIVSKQYAEQALRLSKKHNNVSGEVLALNHLAEHHFRQSHYARSVEYATQSLKLAEQRHDSSAMANAYRVLGNVNTFGLKQYDAALQYQLKALAIYQQRNDKLNIASFCGNVTWIYAITKKNLKEAHRLADLGVHISDSLHNDQLLSYNYNSKGLIYMQERHLDSALYYLDRSIAVAQRVKNFAVIAYNKSIKGSIYLEQRNFKKAIEQFTASLAESQKLNAREVLKDSYGGLASSYEGLHNFPMAYRYHVLYTHLKDSLVNLEITQRALMTEIEFREAKRETKIAELELANDQARKEKWIYIISFGVGCFFLIIIIVLVVRNNRNRTRANEALAEKNIEIADQNFKLKQANAIKDKLFSIIGHDLRSPLVSLKGMLGMVVRNEISDTEFKSFAPKLNQLVTNSNETLENLLQWSNSQMKGWNQVAEVIAMKPLIEKVLTLFSEQAQAKTIVLSHQVDEKTHVYADKNQVELIFRNLVHNAIKFTTTGGSVQIAACEEGNFIKISVMDTGVGLSLDKSKLLFHESTGLSTHGTQGEKGTGLGLTLCKEMANNNDGYLSVNSEEGKGSVFHVFLRKGAPTKAL